MRRVLIAMAMSLLALAHLAPAAHADAGSSALSILHGWDVRRATAFEHADAAALVRLYAPGSTAARADIRLLGAYDARRVRVVWMQTQVLSVRVLHQAPGRLRLRIVDRVLGSAQGVARCLLLPRRAPVPHELVLHRQPGGWRMVSVSSPIASRSAAVR